MRLLNSKFKTVTPYDFIVSKGFLGSKEKFITLLESVIDFCITLI